MDARHFDSLTRALREAGTRRGFLGLVATLPVLGGLFALLDPDESDAKGRRKRRKKKHKHGKGRRRKHHKKCQADSKGKTCTGKCGPVVNNCKKTVDCGSCTCNPSCDPCFTCQVEGPNAPGTCVVDPDQVGDPCGSNGQVCQADGACACQAGSCPDDAPICQLGQCVPCTTNTQCQIGALGDRCCGGVCRECCDSADCSGTTPICDDGTCVVCDAAHPCPTGQCCAADGSCGACLVFVTSRTDLTGDLDGLGGADDICQDLADAAELPGEYLAWLSDANGSPSTRFVQATVPYRRVDGVQVAADWDDLTTQKPGGAYLAAPIDRTEIEGAPPISIPVWTGTFANGTPDQGQPGAEPNCANWLETSGSGLIGATTVISDWWTRFAYVDCDAERALYCFQQR